ncbi:hypothetical protein O9G_005616 [Rozella allomycis CSF55]|uniref:Uncharacterized protein n=1 Tax=Rozella allomycis (strain CSF55) TaxID=988480 RepID=A0A069C7Y0_ROZAC|nr:hypothetical protein O9G_006045 [Rozella allomycis CSF55]EPZ36924.1 hypothetical protein O9G_005616 [Rozella allomycis CSF55]|eukprot:EPZ36514.1 hypothetical protein O9G_006045 [Rozella allomycis CSF55]
MKAGSKPIACKCFLKFLIINVRVIAQDGGELGGLIFESIVMNEDHRGVVKIIISGTHQNRVKHLDIAYHITRQ